MKIFLWVFIAVMVIQLIGIGLLLKSRDFVRNPKHLVCDLFIGAIWIAWAAYLLGGEA